MPATPEIPRPEHPRPQFVREAWANLNGPWTYTFDLEESGVPRGLAASTGFDHQIGVPFCPESRLSGVGHTDFIDSMWYHRQIEAPAEWSGRRILLHFGGVDYESEAFIDGQSVGRHWGGTCSFDYDVTQHVTPGRVHNLVVHVRDDVRSGVQPAGKQCPERESWGCFYTRTTGIWQTVWLEAVSHHGLRDVHIIPDLDGARFLVAPRFYSLKPGLGFRATLRRGDTPIASVDAPAANGIPLVLPIADPRPWSPADPFLYDLVLEVLDGDQVIDRVRSYAGLRKVHVEGNRVLLNNEPFYLRMVLDQGFYPDGIWTAPSDEALRADIELSMRAGFNGARLHQKVFEERFHYWADVLGYLTWGESASWGMDVKDEVSARNFLAEWREVVVRDRNHPSIIAWTPFNETRDVGDGRQHNRVHRDAAGLTRDLDPTRPVNDASGYIHVDTDLWTVHTYEQDPEGLRAQLAPEPVGSVFRRFGDQEAPYVGQPYIVDEFGGTRWVPNVAPVGGRSDAGRRVSWGYGQDPRTVEEFYQRLERLVDAVLGIEHLCGFCYTQLTDVEQEQNGIYSYDRTEKFDMDRINRIFSEPRQ